MILVVHNAKSGQQSSLPAIKQAMQAHGLYAEYISISANGVQRKVADFAKQKSATIVAAGGDGTVSAVTEIIQGTQSKLGILPVGTLNHFARELNVPLDITKAVATLRAGRTKSVDVASVNDHVFINNSSIGWYPRSLHARDELEGKVGKWPAALYGSLRAAAHPRRYHVQLVVGGQTHTYRTPFVFVANNAYMRAPAGLGQRKSLQEGKLAVYVVKAQTALGILRMLGHAVLTRKARSRDFAIHTATACTIHTKKHRRLSVATDGEVMRLNTPLHYRTHAKALRVIVP